MARVLILVEGQTEERFVKSVLEPHLNRLGVYPIPTIATSRKNKTGPDFKGGLRNWDAVRNEIQNLLRDTNAALVSTMFDYYGLPSSFPGRNKPEGSTCYERVEYVEAAIDRDIGAGARFASYVQLHEYEALLFSSPRHIVEPFPQQDDKAEILQG